MKEGEVPAAPVPLPHAAALDVAADGLLALLRPRDVAVALLTYNNASAVKTVADAVAQAVEGPLAGVPTLLLNVDAGSSDGTPDLVSGASVPSVQFAHASSLTERLTVPFHGVPGRGAALATAFTAAHRVGARALLIVEADVTSITADWIAALARPILEEKADFVSPAYARHRYEGTITNLLIAPLIRALYGRRLRQPLGGHQAFSARLVEHLLVQPRWGAFQREIADLWIVGTAIADGFTIAETWLGRRVVRSTTRSADLPTMIAQTLGATFQVMHAHEDLWLEVRGSEPVSEIGPPAPPGIEPGRVDIEQMRDGFRRGLRDLLPIWEHILAPETLGEVFGLDEDGGRFRFPDDLWARVVYDFALGYHYDVVHRDHLLRSLVPLYLGRTAAFVLEAEPRSAEASEALFERVAAAFERQKPYLTERWR
jgi:hypothetical protein